MPAEDRQDKIGLYLRSTLASMEKRLKQIIAACGDLSATRATSALMRNVRAQCNASTEMRLRGALIRAKVRGWRVQYAAILGKPDFFFEGGVAVFVDGCFWHNCPTCGHLPTKNSEFWAAKLAGNAQRDRRVNDLLQEEGLVVVRFWEHELRDDLNGCVDRVRRALVRKPAKPRKNRAPRT
jgi:DNA mismatch endonuclease, patch repair protein